MIKILTKDGSVYQGTVVPSESWDKPGTFRMTTGLPAYFGFPVRVIPWGNVAKVLEGETPVNDLKKVPIVRDTITFIPSSQPGRVWEVIHRVDSDTWSCNCPGFQYRRSCRHIGEAAKSIEKQRKTSAVK